MLSGTMCLSDEKQWEHFHPELVTKFGCHIQLESDGWHVIFFANYTQPGAEFKKPLSVRHTQKSADRDCEKWMKEARKRIAAVRQAHRPDRSPGATRKDSKRTP